MVKKANQILHKPFSTGLTRLLLQAISVGLVTGLIVSVFRWIINQSLQILYHIYPQMAANHLLLIPYIALMILICFVLGKIMAPVFTNITGSGVPQIEAVLLNENKMNWWQILWRKFVGCLLVICPGLMLGHAGPSIEMGAMVGQGFGQDVFHENDDEIKILQKAGIAAGLSAAFSAPLAGVFFLVEVITTTFNQKEVIVALIASFSADLVTLFFFGTQPSSFLTVRENLSLKYYWILPLLGILLGLLAYVYQYCLLSLRPLFDKITIIPKQYHSIIPLILIIPVGLQNAHLLGGSHLLIRELFDHKVRMHLPLKDMHFILVLLLMVVVRFIFSMLSYGSSVPGGIFMPVLSLGATIGVVFAGLLVQANLLPAELYTNIVIASMAAYFGAIEKAPFTAIILITEMVGSVQQVLPMTITTIVAYYVLHLLGGRPIYKALRIQMNFKKA